jgi:hypothetical protein
LADAPDAVLDIPHTVVIAGLVALAGYLSVRSLPEPVETARQVQGQVEQPSLCGISRPQRAVEKVLMDDDVKIVLVCVPRGLQPEAVLMKCVWTIIYIYKTR